MAIDFPSGPSVNQEHSANGKTWIFDGAKWAIKTVDTAAVYEITNTNESELSSMYWMGV